MWIQFILVVGCILVSGFAEADSVKPLNMFMLAYYPVEVQNSVGKLVTEPEIIEHKLFNKWNYNIGRQPRKFDLIALIENNSDAAIGPVEVTISHTKRIVSFDDLKVSGVKVGEWGPESVYAKRELSVVEAQSVALVKIVDLRVQDLWSGLWENEQWPAEVSFSLSIECQMCSTKTKTKVLKLIPGD